MTDADWKAVLGTLAGLWPDKAKSLTEEQVNVWRTVCDPYPWQWCQQVLRDLAMSMRFFPRPCEVRAKLEAMRSRVGGGETQATKEVTAGDLARQNLMYGFPNQSTEIETMTDDEANHALQKNFYHQATRVNGHRQPSTIRQYWLWQHAAHKCGLRPAPPEYREGWSEASRSAYEAETGIDVHEEENTPNDCQMTSISYNRSDGQQTIGERDDTEGSGIQRDDADEPS